MSYNKGQFDYKNGSSSYMHNMKERERADYNRGYEEARIKDYCQKLANEGDRRIKEINKPPLELGGQFFPSWFIWGAGTSIGIWFIFNNKMSGAFFIIMSIALLSFFYWIYHSRIFKYDPDKESKRIHKDRLKYIKSFNEKNDIKDDGNNGLKSFSEKHQIVGKK